MWNVLICKNIMLTRYAKFGVKLAKQGFKNENIMSKLQATIITEYCVLNSNRRLEGTHNHYIWLKYKHYIPSLAMIASPWGSMLRLQRHIAHNLAIFQLLTCIEIDITPVTAPWVTKLCLFCCRDDRWKKADAQHFLIIMSSMLASAIRVVTQPSFITLLSFSGMVVQFLMVIASCCFAFNPVETSLPESLPLS